MQRIGLLILALMLFVTQSHAAKINANGEGDVPFIAIDGEIELGDDHLFEMALNRLRHVQKPPVIALSSPGGNLHAAVRIGLMLREAGAYTLVYKGNLCASACALIWLAGTSVSAYDESEIGLHQAWFERDGRAEVSGQGNAMIGYYIARLGGSERLVRYATEAGPSDMKFLTFEDAARLGIDVIRLTTSEDRRMGRNEPDSETRPALPGTGVPTPGSTPRPDEEYADLEAPDRAQIERAVKNSIIRHRQAGLRGLSESSRACWRLVTQKRSARVFQYCIVLDLSGEYIFNKTSRRAATVPRRFAPQAIIARAQSMERLLLDAHNLPPDYFKQWGATAYADLQRRTTSRRAKRSRPRCNLIDNLAGRC